MRKRLLRWLLGVVEEAVRAYVRSRPEVHEQLDQEFIEKVHKIQRRSNPLPIDLMTTGEEKV